MDEAKDRNEVALRKSELALPAPLRIALTRAKEALRPIDPKLLAIKLAETIELWGTPENWGHIVGFYREALDDLPEDVAMAALKSARMRCKWLPKPSEIRAFADEEMSHRAGNLRHARRAADMWRDDSTPAIDTVERKKVGQLMGNLVQQLGGTHRRDERKRIVNIRPRKTSEQISEELRLAGFKAIHPGEEGNS